MRFKILVFVFLPFVLLGQNNFGLQIKEGIITIDQLKAGIDPVGIYQDIAFKTEIFANYYISSGDRADLGIGVGYSHINFFGVSDPSIAYIATKLSYDHNLSKFGVVFTGEVDTYILPNKNYKHALHKRFYSNFLIGVGKKFGKNLRVSLQAPISIMPIYRGKLGVLVGSEFVETRIRAEELGLYLAMEYRF